MQIFLKWEWHKKQNHSKFSVQSLAIILCARERDWKFDQLRFDARRRRRRNILGGFWCIHKYLQFNKNTNKITASWTTVYSVKYTVLDQHNITLFNNQCAIVQFHSAWSFYKVINFFLTTKQLSNEVFQLTDFVRIKHKSLSCRDSSILFSL